MPIKPWFPTLIYTAPLRPRGNAPFARTLLEDCHKLRDHDAAGRRWSARNYPGGYTSYGSRTDLHKTFSTFMDLERSIRGHVRRFAGRLEMDLQHGRLEMTDCWVNVMGKHTVHTLHLHPLAVVSGTYYVATPPGSSKIRFEDPRLDRFMGAPPKRPDCRPENRQQVSYDVAAGHVVLFESWLRHEVAPNPSRGERVSISFNYNWI